MLFNFLTFQTGLYPQTLKFSGNSQQFASFIHESFVYYSFRIHLCLQFQCSSLIRIKALLNPLKTRKSLKFQNPQNPQNPRSHLWSKTAMGMRRMNRFLMFRGRVLRSRRWRTQTTPWRVCICTRTCSIWYRNRWAVSGGWGSWSSLGMRLICFLRSLGAWLGWSACSWRYRRRVLVGCHWISWRVWRSLSSPKCRLGLRRSQYLARSPGSSAWLSSLFAIFLYGKCVWCSLFSFALFGCWEKLDFFWGICVCLHNRWVYCDLFGLVELNYLY